MTENPTKNIRQYIFGSTESVVLPVGSDAAWEAILTARRANFGPHVSTERGALLSDQGRPCKKCGEDVPKKHSGYERRMCDACWTAQQERKNAA